ncbi:hypothetical protein OAC89_02125 [Deltaproteobacteria bacterium]|nr:hypothetical protein [Deltaproteobacteria bacterium]
MNREGDIVLIHYQDKPTMYARIEAVEPDMKKGWYQITMLLFTIPQQIITWILREEYINGEPFTMGGNSVMMKKVERIPPEGRSKKAGESAPRRGEGKPGKVIPFKNNPV